MHRSVAYGGVVHGSVVSGAAVHGSVAHGGVVHRGVVAGGGVHRSVAHRGVVDRGAACGSGEQGYVDDGGRWLLTLGSGATGWGVPVLVVVGGGWSVHGGVHGSVEGSGDRHVDGGLPGAVHLGGRVVGCRCVPVFHWGDGRWRSGRAVGSDVVEVSVGIVGDVLGAF